MKPMLIVANPWAPGRELVPGHSAFARDLSMSTGSKEMTIKYGISVQSMLSLKLNTRIVPLNKGTHQEEVNWCT